MVGEIRGNQLAKFIYSNIECIAPSKQHDQNIELKPNYFSLNHPPYLDIEEIAEGISIFMCVCVCVCVSSGIDV